MDKDIQMMWLAIDEAKKARSRGDYFFGAVVADENGILSRGGNRVITQNNSLAHVEYETIHYAVGATNARYLPTATLYCTCEPCVMCFGALYWAGIRRVVWAMSQKDLTAHHKKSGNAIHKYRPSPVFIDWAVMARDHGISVEQVLSKEVIDILNGKTIEIPKVESI